MDFEEARYVGYTTCPGVIVPIHLTSPRYSRQVVRITVSLPLH
jgi:hypothetical protein